LNHGKHAGACAGHQRHTLLVQGDRLLFITALDIPECSGGRQVQSLAFSQIAVPPCPINICTFARVLGYVNEKRIP